MTATELEWLEERAAAATLAIEFGSWKGRSSVVLTAARHLVCVDLFVDQPGETGTGEDMLPEFYVAIEPWRAKVTVMQGDLDDDVFREGLAMYYEGEADIVFIDSQHDEASVRRDIVLAQRLVAPGGLICGHDFSPSWPGVIAAVSDIFPDYKRAHDSIWFHETA